ncbi:NADH-quinone oxidoreductase subunit H [Candidatus Woesearchaeota archaeon]|nr:NADH-quinone oxidoreductase subunit H [Candidatus Woesearchaeota archaeon]
MAFELIPILKDVLVAGFVVLSSLIVGLFFMGVDRKIAARLQSRIGPPIVQPFRDVIKLMSKQTIVPDNATAWVFNFAPVFALASVLLLALYLPFFDVEPLLGGYGDLIVVMYLLLMPALALVIGGFAAGSTYSIVGAQRKMIMMMSYEVPFAVLVIAVVWKISTIYTEVPSFSFLTFSQYPVLGLVGPLGIVGVLLLFLALLVALTAEIVRAPFDAPDANTEIADGVFAEYSGRNYALFLIADAVKMCAFVTLLIGLFFPYALSSLVEMGRWAFAGDALFFLLKFLIVALLGLTFQRVAFARLKITQSAKFFWLISAGVSVLGFVLIYVDGLIF